MISRRQFLEVVSVAGGGFVLVPRLGRAQAATAPATTFTDIRRGVGLFEGRGGTIGWYASKDALVVVDSQYPETAKICLEGLRQKHGRGVDLLVNTHHHGDHTAGNATLKEASTRVLAHANVPDLQRRAAEESKSAAAQVYADRTFTDVWREDIGGETLRAQYYGPAHTSGDAVVTFEKANVVHMGDLVFNRVFPVIDRRNGASIANWIVVLEKAVAAHDQDTRYIFGHGAGILGGRADVLVQRDFMSALLETVRKAHAAGESKEEVQKRTAVPGFENWKPLGTFATPARVFGIAYDEVSGAPPR